MQKMTPLPQIEKKICPKVSKNKNTFRLSAVQRTKIPPGFGQSGRRSIAVRLQSLRRFVRKALTRATLHNKLLSTINCGYLFPRMTQLRTDREPRFVIDLLLRQRQFCRARSAGRWRRPTGQFPVARLRVLVAVPVDALDSCLGTLILEAPELIHVALFCRNEAAPAGKALGRVEHLALRLITDRDLPLAPALGPGVLQHQLVAAIRPLRLNLDRFFAPQAERSLQLERDPRIPVRCCWCVMPVRLVFMSAPNA